MTKRIALFLLVAMMMAVFTASAVAQDTITVKGVCKDENGKPIAGATVELNNLDNGRKITVKTDSHGQYYAIGAHARKLQNQPHRPRWKAALVPQQCADRARR